MKLLVEIDGNKIVRQLELTKDSYTLGRDTECDLAFDTGKVSRLHAELMRQGDGFTVVDKNSRNHVYVNGEQVKSKKLTSGDVLNISRKVSLLYIAEHDMNSAINRLVDNLLHKVNKRYLLQLKEVTGRISSLDKLDTILHIVLSEAIRFVGAERGFIALTDNKGRLSANAFVAHAMPFEDEEGFREFVSNSTVEKVIASREAVIIENTRTLAKEAKSRSVVELALGSILCFPLLFNESLVGVLYVDAPIALSLASAMDPFYFSILTDQAAIAIENAKLFDKLEQQVQQTEYRYQQLIELTPDAIILQVDGVVSFINPAATKLLAATSSSQLLGLHCEDLITGENVEAVTKCLMSVESACSFCTFLKKLDGTSVEVELLSKAVTCNGQPSVLIIARDITKRRQMELEGLRAQKLDSISTLAGGLAHDFNNLLTAVMGNIAVATLKLKEGKVDEAATILGKSELACFQAQDLTHQLLTFACGGEPIRKVISLAELLKEAVPFVLSGTNVKAVLKVPETLSAVEVDRGQIVQVVNNISVNAVQAMPVGGELRVRAENLVFEQGNALNLNAGKYVHIEFKDQGVGIPAVYLPKIFDPYFTTKQKGSGLGLATAYSILKRHFGAISAESSAKGSSFHLYLPATDKEVPKKIEAVVDASFSGGTVLVMDDESTVLEVATAMLNALGFEVKEATNGQEAIDLYKAALEDKKPYVAVIMDLTIPGGMGGAQAIKELLKIDPTVRAVVSSGYSNDAVMANHKKYGFLGVMEKPYNLQRLTAVMAEILL